MIVKMIILRFLGSSDAKEKEKIGVVRPEAPVHPMVVGRTDAMVFWCRRKSKPSQPIGTG
jgi:hypothetical protein